MRNLKKIAVCALCIGAVTVAFTGCKEKDPVKEAQKNLKKAAENVQDAAEDAVKRTEKAVKDAVK